MKSTFRADPLRDYRKAKDEPKLEGFRVTLELREDRWMTRINGGVAFPSTNVEIFLWGLLHRKEVGDGT